MPSNNKDIQEVINDSWEDIYKILYRKLYFKTYYRQNSEMLKQKTRTAYARNRNKQTQVIETLKEVSQPPLDVNGLVKQNKSIVISFN